MNGDQNIHTPSPLQKIEHPFFAEKEVTVYIKRDDLIHPLISGNKWRKLEFNLQDSGDKEILTFGGAFSNHIAATAAACRTVGKRSIGIIRGEATDPLNPTLALAKENGMTLDFVSRKLYKEKDKPEFIRELNKKYKDPYFVPEGGANLNGIKGCKKVIEEIEVPFDAVICAIGTGATVAGLALGLKSQQKVIGISVLKGAYSLDDEIDEFIRMSVEDKSKVLSSNNLEVLHDYHFGGYAKINDELIQFMRDFYVETSIKTDPVYSGKSLYALFDLLKKDFFQKGSVIVYYHCGGLQGIKGIEKRYKLRFYD